MLCGHLGHPRSKEKAKSQQDKKKPSPSTTEKVRKQLHLQMVFFGVLAPSRGSATDRAEGHRPFCIPCATSAHRLAGITSHTCMVRSSLWILI